MFIHEGGNGGRHGVGHCVRHEVGGGKHMIPSILEQILMLWHNIRHSAKEIKHFDEIWPSYLTFEIL